MVLVMLYNNPRVQTLQDYQTTKLLGNFAIVISDCHWCYSHLTQVCDHFDGDGIIFMRLYTEANCRSLEQFAHPSTIEAMLPIQNCSV